MDYKVKYEQALERCKKEFNFNNLAYSHEEIKQRLERVFPELKESEDERVRKEIIEYLEQSQFGEERYQVDDIVRGYITWLEKQDSYFRNWTIQDAKDGDVLVTPNNNIFIFKEIRNHYQVFDHCGLYFDSLIVESSCVNGIFSKELPNDYKLATKEQSDLLFQKMKEAGYEWDDEKNELRKIEQNSAWSEEDNGMMILIAKILDKYKSDTDFVLYNTPYGNVVKWLKSITKRMKGE